MERLLHVDRNLLKNVRFAFEQGYCFVSANTRVDMFEPGSALSPDSVQERLKQIIDEISICFEIIDTLNLSIKDDRPYDPWNVTD